MLFKTQSGNANNLQLAGGLVLDSYLLQELISAINNEYKRRKGKNQNYSLRAFAKYLDLDTSHLSKFLRGKKGLSKNRLLSLGKKLHLKTDWLTEVQSISKRGKNPRNVFNAVDEIQFQKIHHWYYWAILELPLLKGFQSNPEWIANILGISTEQASEALTALKSFGFVDQKPETKKISLASPISVSYYHPGQTSHERRENQKQFLRKAIEALDHIPIEWREQSTMIMATNPKNLQKARLLTRKFRRDMNSLLVKGKGCEDLYVLSISLFPLTKN